MQLAPGVRLGPYEVLSAIGAGGMGEVWRARDSRLERDVAIKVLPASFAGNASLRSRFEREAKAISSLNHPHICTLHDVGEEHGVHYLVMELIEGESLADRLAKGALPCTGNAVRHRDRRGARHCASTWHRASRPQAGQRHDHARGREAP
jgi:eukaryotic-like serine/threonine-protein kinase